VDAAVDRIEVRATASNIPNEILIDISEMTVNDVIRLGDITLPKGVTAVANDDLVVVTVLTSRAEAEQPAAAAAGEATPEGAAPADGAAPAAGDNKPAAS
jgi:large subunit ribosomal protein L25